jgi:hypothetical protein
VVWLWNSEVLVSSSLAPLRYELQVVEAAEAGFEIAVLQKKISFYFPPVKGSKGWGGSKCLLAPHTSGPRDVPRCGALSLLQKDAALQGTNSAKPPAVHSCGPGGQATRQDRPQHEKKNQHFSDHTAGKYCKAVGGIRLRKTPNAAKWYVFQVELGCRAPLSISKVTEATALNSKSIRLHHGQVTRT